MNLKEYFQQQYQGYESFLENVIFPIFGEENFEDGFEEDILANHPQYITEARNTGIKSIIRVGNILLDFNPISIFDICVDDHTQLARNRVGVQHLIRRMMDTYSSAFMIFHYNDATVWDWRFSFCRKGNGNDDSTESKRYTFLLGPNQSCRTAAENFEKLLAKGGSIDTADIVKAFDVEALSDEFFARYKEQYEKFVEYITGTRFVKKAGKWVETKTGEPHPQMYDDFHRDNKLVRDYIKKLLGRIVFLHFLQKKGWLGDGDTQFMLHLYERATEAEKDDFLDSVLEPLFHGVLNTKPEERRSVFERNGWNTALLHGWQDMPYLNGGLFERDSLDEIPTRFPREMFSELLQFFYQYNFTIDENDPNDAQVGVDPEMLGRIFENLLEDNKDKGAYYTPKEIVRYMCRQSLTAYLQTDFTDKEQREAIAEFVRTYDVGLLGGSGSEFAKEIDDRLKEVKICDPAIGSGAFPMGLLRELFLCRGAIENFSDAAGIKRHIIQKNIYGVDIERGAVDIARLRFWLSLIVDEQEPQALPNLDYKIMQGNSLLEQYKGFDMSRIALSDPNGTIVFDDETCNRALIQEHIRKYFDTDNHTERQLLRLKISDAVKALIRNNGTSLSDEELSALNIQSNPHFFLWHTWFSDVLNRPSPCNGFDIVIGNPPYISAPTQVASGQLYEQRERIVACGEYKSLYQKWDIYIPFMEKGLQMLAKQGVLAMIVPYPLVNQNYAKKMRQMLLSDYSLFELVDLNGTKIFENATVSNCIPFVRNAKGSDRSATISRIKNERDISRCYSLTYTSLMPQGNAKLVYNLEQPQAADESLGRYNNLPTLGDICYISVGMVLNADEKTAKGEFCKEDLISDTADSIHCRKYIEAKDIERYRVKRVRYLEYNTPRCPDHLRRPTFRELYEREKLLFNRLGALQVYIDVDTHYLHSDSMFSGVLWNDLHDVQNKSIAASVKRYSRLSRSEMEKLSAGYDLRYLLGVMNSKAVAWLLEKQRGGDYHIYPEHLRNIPIPAATTEQQSEIIALVDRILEAKRANPQADTSREEQAIDRIVYHLYSLTYAEVKTIDPATPLTEVEYNFDVDK